jgi:hypothetical protein
MLAPSIKLRSALHPRKWLLALAVVALASCQREEGPPATAGTPPSQSLIAAAEGQTCSGQRDLCLHVCTGRGPGCISDCQSRHQSCLATGVYPWSSRRGIQGLGKE